MNERLGLTPPERLLALEAERILATGDAIGPRGGPIPGSEVFIPLAVTFPDVDGATFALAGFTTASGQSYLHVIASGLPRPAGRLTPEWTPGWSWWVRDVAGNWHVALAGEPGELGDGLQSLWLKLTPPLSAHPAEIVVTGPTRRAVLRVPPPAPAAHPAAR